MTSLNNKIKDIFYSESVYKTTKNYDIFSGKNLPSFIKDWLIKRYTNEENGELNFDSLNQFMNSHLAQKNNKIKAELISGNDTTLLCRIIIDPNVKTGKFRFSIPDIGISLNEGVIKSGLIESYQELKQDKEVWGIASLSYKPPCGKEQGVVELVEYKPFKPYDVDIDYFREIRKKFSLEEWVDLLIQSMEYNPSGYYNFTQKINFLARLLIFVEPRLNIIELAPKGTGKSYVFNNLSKYGWLFSGGTVSRAKLFYDVGRSMEGIIKHYDFVALDEIQTIKFTDEDELRGALKSYLESGTFSVANFRGTSNAGMILLGNIEITNSEGGFFPVNKRYFSELQQFFKETALLDRFHGFIEGWHLPRINEDLKVKGYTLNVEYFSEILHSLRFCGEFSSIVNELIEIPPKADTRDVNAIKKLASGYLKLLFPHIKTASEISKEDFKNFCLLPAISKRQIIREQIHLMDSEYVPNVPDIRVK